MLLWRLCWRRVGACPAPVRRVTWEVAEQAGSWAWGDPAPLGCQPAVWCFDTGGCNRPDGEGRGWTVRVAESDRSISKKELISSPSSSPCSSDFIHEFTWGLARFQRKLATAWHKAGAVPEAADAAAVASSSGGSRGSSSGGRRGRGGGSGGFGSSSDGDMCWVTTECVHTP